MTEQEHLQIIANAIKSRFELLAMRTKNNEVKPTKDYLESLIKLTELDLNLMKEIVEKI